MQKLDVLVLSEHWLYEDELSFLDSLNDNFSVISCTSADNNIRERWKRGQGGVALFLKKTLKVREIQTASDRLASVSLKIGNITFVIVAVYLPSRNNDLKEYMKTLDTLKQFCVRHKSCGTKLLLLGDFNAHIKEDKLSQDWNNRGKRLQTFLSKMNLVAVNLSPWCENPQFTYLSNTGNSIVDYIFVGNDVIEYVDLVQVLKEHPDNIAFHLPVTISINLHSDVTEEETSNDNMNYLFEKISWKSCTTEHLHSYNQKLVNSATDLLSKDFSDINNIYEELGNLIKSAAMVLPRVQ